MSSCEHGQSEDSGRSLTCELLVMSSCEHGQNEDSEGSLVFGWCLQSVEHSEPAHPCHTTSTDHPFLDGVCSPWNIVKQYTSATPHTTRTDHLSLDGVCSLWLHCCDQFVRGLELCQNWHCRKDRRYFLSLLLSLFLW